MLKPNLGVKILSHSVITTVSIDLPILSNCFELGHTNILALLLLDGERNFPGFLDAFLGTFAFHFPLSDKGGNVCADIFANLFRGAKGCRLSAISCLGKTTGSNIQGIGRDGKGQDGKGKGFHLDGLLILSARHFEDE